MKAVLKLMVWFGLTISFLSFGWDIPMTRADDDSDEVNEKVKWERIVGILSPSANVGGFIGAGGPWTAQRGSAVVDLSSGKTKFEVHGLVLAFQPRPLAGTPIIGTTGFATQVKGTLVCDAFASLPPTPNSFVDTPAVPMSAEGDAEFKGVVSIPDACLDTPQRLAFLIRVANPGTLITDLWIAHGAARQP